MSPQAAPATVIKKDPFEDMVVDDDQTYVVTPIITDQTNIPVASEIPARYSVGWTKYVMDQFDKSELQDNNPTCDGTRRLFHILIGPIIAREVTIVQVPDIGNGGRATVKCRISYIDKNDGYTKVVEDVADCWKGNTEQPYCIHPTATASTMAEGRALRKGLGLGVLLREEKTRVDNLTAQEASIELDSNNGITDAQKIVIKNAIKNQGLSLERTLAYFEDKKLVSSAQLESLSSEEARTLIQEINRFGKDPKSNGVATPEELILTVAEKTNTKSKKK